MIITTRMRENMAVIEYSIIMFVLSLLIILEVSICCWNSENVKICLRENSEDCCIDFNSIIVSSVDLNVWYWWFMSISDAVITKYVL